MTASLVTLEDVHRSYDDGRVQALCGVNLTVQPGEWLTVVGPSGSGKSTLLHLMSGLDQPDQGRVLFAGHAVKSIGEWTDIRSRKIGFIFQSFHLLPTLTALENVQLPMFGVESFAGKRREKAFYLLEKVGLKDRATHLPADLSGGERQRVALARSLANDPQLILADEPTGNLDTVSSGAMMDLLHRLSVETHTTTVLVTHDLDFAQRGHRRIELIDGVIHREVDLSGRG